MPGDPVSANRRSANRYDVAIPAEIVVNGQPREVTICNLSLGGAQVTLPERLALGVRVRLSFRLPEQADVIEVDATVRWVQGDVLGLQFAGLRPKYVWSMNRYLAALQTQALAADETGS